MIIITFGTYDLLHIGHINILENKADIFIMGNDWEGKFDEFNDICKVIYLPRTASISTTEIVEIISVNS